MADIDELIKLYGYDERKYRDNYLTDVYQANETQLVAVIIVITHIIEKGLSNSDFEPGHSFSQAERLIELLKIYNNKEFNTNDLGYVNAISCLKAFYNVHKGTRCEIEVNNILDGFLPQIETCKSKIGGTTTFKDLSKKDNDKKGFKELAEGRFAVREFSDKAVSKNDIFEAVQIATKTPSACNRQSVKVHTMFNRKDIAEVLSIQGGMSSYPTPPALLLITADDNYYEGPTQRNQGFIDGGLFAMSLLYALEYKALGACPLHAIFDEMREETIRRMMGLPDKEKLIMFVGVGHFRENNTVCKSFRYPTEHILHEIKETRLLNLTRPKKSNGSLQTAISQANNPEHVYRMIETGEINLGVKLATKALIKSARQKLRPRTRMKALKNRIAFRIKKNQQTKKNRKKDGLIISLTDNVNYGNVIQRYALKQFLQKHGLSFDFLRLKPVFDDEDREVYPDILDFVKKYLDDRPYDPDMLQGYNNYIVGSDQVWRATFWDNFQGGWRPYFLEFLDDDKPNKIAYAASFGMNTLKDAGYNKKIIDTVRPYLKRFNSISVREKTGVKLVKNLIDVDTSDIKFVIDPTLLLEANDYSKLIDTLPPTLKSKTRPKLFAYFLDYAEDLKNVSQQISSKYFDNSYDVFYIRKTQHNSIEEWLKGFRDSKFVITDSFHGVVFSVLNNRDFVVIINETQSVGRIHSLLAALGISEDRIFYRNKKMDINIEKLPLIDWESVNRKLCELRIESGDWLLNMIKRKR